MIIGPRGTPYENGCFIFDIYLPGEYNNIAPLVSSMTTNGGKYRYNPNLYAEGVSHSAIYLSTTSPSIHLPCTHLLPVHVPLPL
jgi:ubiquitin-protein ligase